MSSDSINQINTLLSVGLSGTKEKTYGIGFTIYYREEPQALESVLRTPNKTYNITYNFTTWTHSAYHFVWVTNERIELYINYNLIAVDVGTKTSQNKPILEQEYILLFGNYNYSFNALTTEIIYPKIWRIPLNKTQINPPQGVNKSFCDDVLAEFIYLILKAHSEV